MRILIAEDDRISRRLLERHLEKWGHAVITAEDGKDAWERFQSKPCPIVISDWMMPEMDGLELISKIRNRNSGTYAYTILLTAKSHKSDLIMGMQAGADDFLTKPLDADELKVRLRAAERILKLEQNLAERNEQLKLSNERMKRGLEAASKVQESMLPASLPDIPGINFAWVFRPCEELAGDTLNILKFNDSQIGVYVLDVSGHGISAALWSVMLTRLLSANPDQSDLLLKQHGNEGQPVLRPTFEVANQLNKQFPLDVKTGQYFTFLYGILDVKTREFRYVSAGHPDLIHMTGKKKTNILKVRGLPIGFSENICYSENTIKLNPGDRLILYSDGITEAQNKSGEQYGVSKLVEKLQSDRTMPLKKSLEAVIEELIHWRGSESFDDDATMLALEVKNE